MLTNNRYLKIAGYANYSEFLDFLLFENNIGFTIVIDNETEDLNYILKQLANAPDVIEVKKYTNVKNAKDIIYRSSEFQQDIKEAITPKVKNIREVDTIVCPANEEGFKRAFLGKKAWWAVRISSPMIPQLKYIAMYETQPVKAIRWFGYIQSIKPYEDTGKYIIHCSEIKQIKPIKLTAEEGKRGLAPQAPRYTNFELIKKAKTLKDIY